jgi:hypothetical protein
MKLSEDLQKRFEAIDDHGKVADLQRELKIKHWGNVQKILLGKGGTNPKRIATIKKFIQKREKLINKINEVE